MANFTATKNLKIPTIIGLLLVLILVGVLAVSLNGVSRVTKLFSSAAPTFSPLSGPNVGSVTDTGAVVSWTTDQPTDSTIFYGTTDSLGQIAIDERSLNDPQAKFVTHFILLRNLQKETKYFYKISLGQNQVGDPANNNAPYTFTTSPTLTSTSDFGPLYGKVFATSNQPLNGAIVTFSSTVSGQIVTLSKNDGSYVLPLASARTPDLTSIATFSALISDQIVMDFGSSGSATINCLLGTTALPDVTLNQTINCPGVNPSDRATGSGSGFKVATKSGALEVNITNGETVTSPLPTIEGQALPNQKVVIVIHSDSSYSGSVIAGSDGSWSWTPPGNLSPGEHTVVITVQNPNGSTQTVTRTFIVPTNSPILPITSGTPSSTPKQHKSCVNSSCVLIQGDGTDACSTDSDCSSPTPVTHKECQNNSCISVTGAGNDQCTSNLSCQPPPAPPKKTPPTGSNSQTLILLFFGLILFGLGGASLILNKIRR